jgi:hypothetical protein
LLRSLSGVACPSRHRSPHADPVDRSAGVDTNPYRRRHADARSTNPNARCDADARSTYPNTRCDADARCTHADPGRDADARGPDADRGPAGDARVRDRRCRRAHDCLRGNRGDDQPGDYKAEHVHTRA